VHRPTLDDVFLTLTGRTLRDAEAGGADEARETSAEAQTEGELEEGAA
jgi:ABC-2 type transport system ATP-binding protein